MPEPLHLPPSPASHSPLRYPGGKSWLTPLTRLLERRHPATTPAAALTEVFAGGASVTCDLLGQRGPPRHAHLNELHGPLSVLWQVIFSPRAPELARMILTCDPAEHLDPPSCGAPLPTALHVLARNRVQYGGIIGHAGRMTASGKERRARPTRTHPRWYPDTLARRVQDLHTHASRVQVTNTDALTLLHARQDAPGVTFIDPPYTAAPDSPGFVLYEHALLDHDELMRLAARLRGPWLMTHEHHPRILDLARQHGLHTRDLHMHGNQTSARRELLIARDLTWLPQQTRLI